MFSFNNFYCDENQREINEALKYNILIYFNWDLQFPFDEAAEITVRTTKQFVMKHFGELAVIKWVLFDENTLQVYERQTGHRTVSEMVQSPGFYSMNKMLRDGGV